jgi:hypothetical protein
MNLDHVPDKSQAEVKALVEHELDTFEDSSNREDLRPLLILPRLEMFEWDYGTPAQRYPVWVIALGKRYAKYSLLYSDYGFAPEQSWGLGMAPNTSFGADYCWYGSLERAYVESFLSEEKDKASDGHRPPLH